MNKNRRRELEEIAAKLKGHVDTLKKIEIAISGLQQDLEGVQFNEEWYHDNIPENLQQSERAVASEEALDNIEEALGSLQEGLDSLSEAIAYTEAAAL